MTGRDIEFEYDGSGDQDDRYIQEHRAHFRDSVGQLMDNLVRVPAMVQNDMKEKIQEQIEYISPRALIVRNPKAAVATALVLGLGVGACLISGPKPTGAMIRNVRSRIQPRRSSLNALREALNKLSLSDETTAQVKSVAMAFAGNFLSDVLRQIIGTTSTATNQQTKSELIEKRLPRSFHS